MTCLSTHGATGYAPGTRWDGDVLVCPCGARIEQPRPIGWRDVPYTFADVRQDWRVIWKWVRGATKTQMPLYPGWLGGRRPTGVGSPGVEPTEPWPRR